jgi:hypothetical protein
MQLEEMGEELGAALKRESLFRKVSTLPSGRPLAERRFGDFGIEHVGAAEMYAALLKAQNAFTWNPLRWITGKFTSYDWGLPPIEKTPFRRQDIEEALYQEERKVEIGLDHPTARLVAEALATQRVAVELLDPASLKTGDAERSVELAHEIIERLRNMKFDNANEGLPGVDQQAHDLERGELIAELAMAYQIIMADLARVNPEALSDPSFEAARLAFGKLGHLTYIDAQRSSILESQGNNLPALDLAQRELPEEFTLTYAGEEAELLREIETGLKAAIYHRGGHPGKIRKVEVEEVRDDFQKMHNRISSYSAYIGAATENLVGEARSINRLRQATENPRIRETQQTPTGAPTRSY